MSINICINIQHDQKMLCKFQVPMLQTMQCLLKVCAFKLSYSFITNLFIHYSFTNYSFPPYSHHSVMRVIQPTPGKQRYFLNHKQIRFLLVPLDSVSSLAKLHVFTSTHMAVKTSPISISFNCHILVRYMGSTFLYGLILC